MVGEQTIARGAYFYPLADDFLGVPVEAGNVEDHGVGLNSPDGDSLVGVGIGHESLDGEVASRGQ